MRVSSVKIELVKEKWVSYDAPNKISSAREALPLFRSHIGESDREHFVIILLNIKNRPVGIHTVSIGSASASIVHPREVFKSAILANATSILACHNHPSGEVEPSREDLDITRRLTDAGNLLGIKLLDHIIIGDDDRYLSLADRGLIN